MSEIRLDYGRLRKAKRTPAGGIRVPAFVTRTGVFSYTREDGTTVRELRHPDDVFSADSLFSLADAPVTDGHPPSLVNAQTWKEHAVGYAKEAKRDGKKVASELVVQDQSAIDRIEKGELTEVSCGYTCDSVEESGTYDGERYDRRQKNISYNHCGLGPSGWGRAGRDVALRLDSGGERLGVAFDASENEDRAKAKADARPDATLLRSDSTISRESPAKATGETMNVPEMDAGDGAVRIDGVDYSLGTQEGREQARQALQTSFSRFSKGVRADSENKELNDALQSTVAATIKAQEQLLEALCQNASAPTPEAEALSEEALDALVQKRAALIEHAKELCPEVKMDGLSEREIMTQALAGRGVSVKEDASDEYLRGLFEATKPSRNDSVDNVRKATLEQPETRQDARAQYLEKSAAAWRAPLSATNERTTVERGL